jgi:transcription initiation factor TFIIH subunit 1
MLKIAFNSSQSMGEDSYNFTFTSAASALSDREKFKGEISGMIARNREREAEAATSKASGSTSGPGGGMDKGKGKQKATENGNGAASGGSGGASTPNSSTTMNQPGQSQGGTFRLRKQVLQSSPQLLTLHRELVLSGALTEAEFWEGREQLLESLAAEESLMRGKSGQMVDPKTITGQNGEVTVKITPALIREIFEEFPVVLQAYNDNVPQPVSSVSSSIYRFVPAAYHTVYDGSFSSTKLNSGLATSNRNSLIEIVQQIEPQWIQSETILYSTSI